MRSPFYEEDTEIDRAMRRIKNTGGGHCETKTRKPNLNGDDGTVSEATIYEDEQVLQQAVDLLAARFDTVQIFVSRVEPITSVTVSDNNGWGNWFARVGQVLMWAGQVERGEFEPDDEELTG